MMKAYYPSLALLPDVRKTHEHARAATFYGTLFAPGPAQTYSARDLRWSALITIRDLLT